MEGEFVSHRVAVSAITEVPTRDGEALYRKAAHSTSQNRSLRTRKGRSKSNFRLWEKAFWAEQLHMPRQQAKSPRAQVTCVMEYVGRWWEMRLRRQVGQCHEGLSVPSWAVGLYLSPHNIPARVGVTRDQICFRKMIQVPVEEVRGEESWIRELVTTLGGEVK